MGKPPGLSEGSYVSPNIDQDEDMAAHGANRTATKWIYIAAIVSIVVLFVLLMAGHVPTGGG